MSNIIAQSELRPASFCNGIQRESQTNLIVDLIVNCIKENRIITLDDILNCWFRADKRQSINGWGIDKNGDKKYTFYYPYEREEILKYCRPQAETRAKQWFMNNLGAAIIKGKLLVIPVISLSPSTVTP